MHRRSLTSVVGLIALSLTLTACSGGSAPAPRSAAAPVAAAPTLGPGVPSGEPSQEPSPSASPSPTGEPSPAAPPAPQYDVVAAQKSLRDLGYYIGAADGRRGPALRSAVMAFQKVQGLRADGAIGAATVAALAAPKKPALRGSGSGSRVEVDLTKQVLYVVKGGAISRILPVSSGNGATYEQKDGGTARALTPTGYYRIQRRIVGVREADLGTLYDPQYFYRGWAIHGSNSVPAVPASHGCIRVTRADAKWLLSNISVGMSVYIYGGKHVFTAGSSAPGTDSPTGDTAADSSPPPKASPSPVKPSPKPAPAPSRAPSPSPSPAKKPSPSPSASPPID